MTLAPYRSVHLFSSDAGQPLGCYIKGINGESFFLFFLSFFRVLALVARPLRALNARRDGRLRKRPVLAGRLLD